jgi:hypothetical protein
MSAGDQHRVLSVEADARTRGCLTVYVLIGVHEHAVLAAEPTPELVQSFAQHGVAVMPRVTRESSLALPKRRLRRVVAVGGRHDGPCALEQCLGMARDFGLRHREAHVGKEAAVLSVPDVPFGLRVSRNRRRSDDIELQLLGEPLQLGCGHMRDCAR